MMNTIRIPTRYRRQMNRITKTERSAILMGLFSLASGEDLELYDTPAGDLLELIWRDSIQMEGKNSRFNVDTVGKLFAGHPTTEGKGKEVKGSEGNLINTLEIIEENLDFQIKGKEEVIEKWFLELQEHIDSINAIQTPSKLAEIIVNRVIGDNYWLTNLKTVEELVGNWKDIMRINEVVEEENPLEDEKEATLEEVEEGIKAIKEKPFDSFWKLYPKKKDKGNAEKAWKKLRNPVEKIKLIQEALVWQTESNDWTKEGGQYIPYPASYLNGKRWEDEQGQEPEVLTI